MGHSNAYSVSFRSLKKVDRDKNQDPVVRSLLWPQNLVHCLCYHRRAAADNKYQSAVLDESNMQIPSPFVMQES